MILALLIQTSKSYLPLLPTTLARTQLLPLAMSTSATTPDEEDPLIAPIPEEQQNAIADAYKVRGQEE